MEDLPSNIPLPDTMPIMALSGATQFPRALMPLFIFEQRYRNMLNFVLDGDRMFGVACVTPGMDPESASPDPVCSTFTAGLVRACVTHSDGTSHLMLLGLQRVQIIGWAQVFPFRIANILPVDDLVINETEEQELAYDLISLCQKVFQSDIEADISVQMRQILEMLTEPIVVADMVGNNFITDPIERQEFLEIVLVKERLAYLIEHLHSMI